MTNRSSLYDEDIVLWSEQQAEIIRRLGATRRDLPNELDVENVAEEIESVGRSELAAVESHLDLILGHLIKLFIEPEAEAARHWRSEIVGFHREVRRRYSPSMRQRVDLDDLWRSEREQALVAYDGTPQQQPASELPVNPPFALEDLVRDQIDSAALLERLRAAAERK